MIINSKFPESYGKILLEPEEYCYIVYMPIRFSGSDGHREWFIPNSLEWVKPLLYKVDIFDIMEYEFVYLSVKHTYVDGYQNRSGWHIDGFGSDDINYIWCSDRPTEVCVQEFEISEDHKKSLFDMEDQYKQENVRHIKTKTLYRLDNTIVHRCPSVFETMLRTFVKLSFSNDVYNLKGNASNPLLSSPIFENKVERDACRNHPVKRRSLC